MPDVSFTNLLLVVAVAVAAPLAVGYLPRLRIPAVVLEIAGGIVIGPSVLGWVHVDLPVSILALFGLAFLLFLAGLEIDVRRLRVLFLRFPLPRCSTPFPFTTLYAVLFLVSGAGLLAVTYVLVDNHT